MNKLNRFNYEKFIFGLTSTCLCDNKLMKSYIITFAGTKIINVTHESDSNFFWYLLARQQTDKSVFLIPRCNNLALCKYLE